MAGNFYQGSKNQNNEFKYEIVSHIGSLASNANGWKKEVNIVSWNGRQPRLDIRDWNADHSRMGRGASLSRPECENLVSLLKDFDYLKAGI